MARPQQPATVRVAAAIGDDHSLTGLIADYLRWVHGELAREYGITGLSVDPAEILRSLDVFRPPHGLAVIAEIEGRPVGVGALRQLEPGVVEVKRMYVHPDGRGRHLGSGVLDLLVSQAAVTLHAETVRLDTCRFMHSAQRLYRSRGFYERPPYEGTEIPPSVRQHWMFFEKRLVSGSDWH